MNPALIQHFKLSEEDLVLIKNSLQPHLTVLDVIFEKKLIDESAYLEWAKNHYSLPVLKPAFLEQNNNISMLLDRYKNVFPKNVIPFYEMDGVLYVMCLEPTPFEAPQPVQYVLAPYSVISHYAPKNETSIVPEQTPPTTTVKEETNPLFKELATSTTTTEQSPLDNFSFDNLKVETSSEETLPANMDEAKDVKLEEKQDIPAGLNFPPNPTEENSAVTENPVTAVDLNSFKFDNLLPSEESPAPKKTPEPVSTPEPVKPIIQEQKPAVAPAATQQPVVPPVTPQPVAKPVTPTPVAAPAAAEAPKPVSGKNMTSFSVNDLVAKSKPKTQPAAPAPTPAPQQVASQPVAAQPVATPAAPAPQVAQQPVAQVSPQKPTDSNHAAQFEGILNSMKKYFEKSMVLIFKGGALEPFAWDQNWVKAPHAQSAIDTSTPSIFRIVNETQKPYHGYIVSNHINEAFFNTWNQGQIPEHVTICPIVHDKKMYGMILGATTKEGAKKYQLHHIQEIANDAFAMLSSIKAA